MVYPTWQLLCAVRTCDRAARVIFGYKTIVHTGFGRTRWESVEMWSNLDDAEML